MYMHGCIECSRDVDLAAMALEPSEYTDLESYFASLDSNSVRNWSLDSGRDLIAAYSLKETLS
jgi:hypothetical protein